MQVQSPIRVLRVAALLLSALVVTGCTKSYVDNLPRGPEPKRLQAVETPAGVVLAVPDCPDWSKEVRYNYTNTVHSNFGCADATNLGLMVANPEDVLRGRDPGAMDGTYAAGAVERYRKGETKELNGPSATGDAGTSQ